MHQDNINPERDPHISAEHQYLGMNKTSYMVCSMC